VTLFAGTAAYYLRYRPPYPDEFLSELRSRAKTTGRGALLDLACGPGRVAIPLAPHFDRVLAVDVEPEMIEVAREEAGRRGVENVDWLVERAEDLQLPPGSVELITIGEAFHRLDRQRVLKCALRSLRRGGSLVTLGGEPVWRGQEEWKRVLVRVVNEWTGQSLPDPRAERGEGFCNELRAAGLDVQEHDSVVERIWTCDSIIGFLFSTSIASRRVLGDRASRFEEALRGALLGCEPSDRFPSLQGFGFTLGTKGGDEAVVDDAGMPLARRRT
jgi:SAM-dependent methyltransferase